MAWAYVFAMLAWAFIPGVKRQGKLLVPLILILGILPDSDLLWGSFGIVHRTVTHSFFLWILLLIPVFVVFRLKAVPYFVAVVQHFAFGDFLMGKVMIFWPFDSKFFGFGFGMPSVVDVTLETAGLILAVGILIYVCDLRRLLSVDKRNVLMVLPSLALFISTLFFALHWSSINSLIAYILSNNLLIILALGHIILLALLAISSIQGLRALKPRSK